MLHESLNCSRRKSPKHLCQVCLSDSQTRQPEKLTLQYLFAVRGAAEHVRSDNGPEFIARNIQQWLNQAAVGTLYINKASPWENGYVESFNGKLRDELLNGEIFYTLREAQVIIEGWRREYNTFRPHSSLGYRPPAPETVQWLWPRDEKLLLGLT